MLQYASQRLITEIKLGNIFSSHRALRIFNLEYVTAELIIIRFFFSAGCWLLPAARIVRSVQFACAIRRQRASGCHFSANTQECLRTTLHPTPHPNSPARHWIQCLPLNRPHLQRQNVFTLPSLSYATLASSLEKLYFSTTFRHSTSGTFVITPTLDPHPMCSTLIK